MKLLTVLLVFSLMGIASSLLEILNLKWKRYKNWVRYERSARRGHKPPFYEKYEYYFESARFLLKWSIRIAVISGTLMVMFSIVKSQIPFTLPN